MHGSWGSISTQYAVAQVFEEVGASKLNGLAGHLDRLVVAKAMICVGESAMSDLNFLIYQSLGEKVHLRPEGIQATGHYQRRRHSLGEVGIEKWRRQWLAAARGVSEVGIAYKALQAR